MATFTLLPKDNPHQVLRLYRTLMAYGFYLIAYLILCFAIRMGLLQFSTFLWFAAGTTLLYLVFYTILRSGLNLRLRDPSLTMTQMLISVFIILVMMYNCDEIRWVFVTMFMVVFLFGIFRLRSGQFLIVVIFSITGYAAMVALLVQNKSDIYVKQEVFQWLAFSGMLPFFALMANYINSIRRKLEESLQIIKQMASHDELTGVFNRRRLMEKLDDEKNRVDRAGHSFCICMLDIDFFKNVNDTLGHLCGDEVLKSFAKIACDGLRSTDYLARYGGEEFVLVLPHTAPVGAWQYCERLRYRIEKAELLTASPTFRITVSIGLTEYLQGENIAETIDRADQSLYLAKRRGRNRIEMIDERGNAFDANQALQFSLD